VVVLTGAGCSTDSGLADYRDELGQWKRPQPITGQLFINDQHARHRYWTRSAVGWPQFSKAKPNRAHAALAELERSGVVRNLITQNVDGLHQQAGHQSVIDLHGILSAVVCIGCNVRIHRDELQHRLLTLNPWLSNLSARHAPDGDADLENNIELQQRVNNLAVPACDHCRGILKPDVVFFGENVPKLRVEKAMQQLRDADVLLVAGSSLMVFSGYRFCKDAHQRGQPIVIINQGKTRADEIASEKISGDCAQQLQRLAEQLSAKQM